MNLLHAVVHHQTFGQGEVIQLSDDVVSVSFPKPHGKKKFLFPTAFYQHLTIEDDSISSEMVEVLKQNHILVEAEEQRVGRANRMAQFRADSIEKANGVKAKAKPKKKK
jgi:transcription elongation factor GreA-like protein